MTDPVPGVKYRIQSLDYLTYLELADGSSSVRLRPAKETDRQYWQFEHVSGSSSYYVRNVANTNQYLSYCTSKIQNYTSKSAAITATGTAASSSLVNVSCQNGAYKLAFHHNSTNHYFYTADSATTVYVTSDNNLEQQKWQLVPVTSQPIDKDQLQSGTYSIRNLRSKKFLTMPDGQSIGSTNVYVRSQFGQRDQGAYQCWTVTRQRFGHYTIQNAGNNSYLGSNATISIKGSGLVGSQDAYLWNIHSVGGFAWSLRIPAAELSVGTIDYETNDDVEMSLVLSDNTSSQIWFMEKYIPHGQDKIYAKREVDEGKYLLRNANNSGIYMNAFSTPWRIIRGTATTSEFELKYIDENSAHFTLTYVTTSNPVPVVADVGGYLGLADKGSEFVLLKEQENHQQYFICRSDPARLHDVVSTRFTTDVNRNSVFTIEKMAAGDAMQMWFLVPVSSARL